MLTPKKRPGPPQQLMAPSRAESSGPPEKARGLPVSGRRSPAVPVGYRCHPVGFRVEEARPRYGVPRRVRTKGAR